LSINDANQSTILVANAVYVAKSVAFMVESPLLLVIEMCKLIAYHIHPSWHHNAHRMISYHMYMKEIFAFYPSTP
jgi:hypothetical protein